MAPCKFGDIGKKASDVLSEDYKFDTKYEVKSKLENGVALKGTFTRAEKDLALGAILELKKTFKPVDCTVKLDHCGSASVTFEESSLVPNGKSKAEFSLDGSTRKGTFDYKHDMFVASVTGDLVKSSASMNCSVGFQDLVVGLSSSYSSKGFANPTVSAQYTLPEYVIGVATPDLGKTVSISCYKNISKELGFAVSVNTNASGGATGSAGTDYKIDADSKVKCKVDSSGIVSALYTQKIRPKATLKITGQVNVANLSANNAHKIGLTLLMDY